MSKIVTAKEAVSFIKDEAMIGINGFAFGFGFPEELAQAIEERFLTEGHPKNLNLLFASGCGDLGKSHFGMEHFAHEKMVKRVIAGHVGLAKKFSQMIFENKVEAYNIPQGVVTHLFRESAGKRPGVVTHVGLETFVDPRVDGGKMNDVTKEDYVQLIHLNGQEKLFYPSVSLDVAFIRGTVADESGNISIKKEGVFLETLHIAEAAKNAGGIVIAQVEHVTQNGSIPPLEVLVPGIMVDYIVIADPKNHQMNAGTKHDGAFTGEIKKLMGRIERMPMSVRKVIAKRCAWELEIGSTINLGVGMPEGVAAIALEEGISEKLTMTIEAGSIGGIPGSGFNLGAATNVEAIIGQPNIFDYYDGGGLDQTFLGLAQADQSGNINVSKFNGRMVGCGGFINISQNTPKVVYCGTFTAGRSNIEIVDGELKIIEDGNFIKFVDQVEQISFSGDYAVETGQEVLYVTERAVFRLIKEGLELIEIAPGIDLENDILAKMEFKPVISKELKLMDRRLFTEETLGLNT